MAATAPRGHREGLGRRVALTLTLVGLGAAWGADAAATPPSTRTTVPTRPPVVVSVRDGGFDWADAGVGAAATLAVTLLAVGLVMALRPRPSTATRKALSSAQREEP